MNITLRPYQEKAVADLRQAFRDGYKAPLLASPTGSGKTIEYCYIAENAAKRGNSIMILVHRKEILQQTSDQLDAIGVDHGVICPGRSMTPELVQVASVQTLVRRLGRVREPQILVIDEAHHSAAGSWKKILAAFQHSYLLGVTATPCRLDGKCLGVMSGGHFDKLILGPTVADLVADGWLSQPVVYAPPSGVNTKNIHTKFGDYVKPEIEALMDKPKITGCAVEHYLRICPGAPAIAFCTSIQHSEHVCAAFREAGVTAESLDGTMTDQQRHYRIEGLGTGKFHVLTSCEIVSEGTDIPVVTAAILLRPTQSMGLFLQQVGRCLRPHPAKKHSIILDHVGNCFRHGLPDENREWTLEGTMRRKKNSQPAIRYRQCERCYFVHLPAPTCPHCGYIYPVDGREVEQVDGQLEVIDGVKALAMRREQKRSQGRAASEEDLYQLGLSRGYKDWNARAWARHVMAARSRKRAMA